MTRRFWFRAWRWLNAPDADSRWLGRHNVKLLPLLPETADLLRDATTSPDAAHMRAWAVAYNHVLQEALRDYISKEAN